MSEKTETLPDIQDALTAPFWRAAQDHRLVVQRCSACGFLRWPPGPLCPECQSLGGEWTEVRPSGTLWSVAEYYRAFDQSLAGEIPYAVGLVELDDGPRMYGRLRGAVGSFEIGSAVRAVFRSVAPETTLVEWENANGLGRSCD
jgi:uncharacterized OB-fold protein